MKLELKNLVPYLPYGLNMYHSAFMFRSNWNENEIGVMIGVTDNIQNETFDIVMIRERDKYKLQDSRNHFKPILRPLSDLTKEIEHNGKKFVPTKALSIWDLQGITVIDIPHIPVNLYELLLKWHFDVFGLIEQNLAININTL